MQTTKSWQVVHLQVLARVQMLPMLKRSTSHSESSVETSTTHMAMAVLLHLSTSVRKIQLKSHSIRLIWATTVSYIGQVEDCNGVLGGDALLDECGVCDNDPGNDGFLDECGTCDSDPTNDCEQDCEGTWGGDVTECGNTTVWLSCDENFEEIRWGLFDEDFMFVTDGQGAASEADGTSHSTSTLRRTYNFGIFDAGDNGGCEVEVRVFGDFAAGESTDGYTGRSLLEFVVPEPPLGTIVDLVVESPQFSTLEAAVVAAGLG